MKKIAIITIGLSKVFAGEKCGGGEILLRNLILELMNTPDVKLFVFTSDEKELTQKIKNDYPKINFEFYNKSPYSYEYIDEFKILLKNEVFDKVINYNMFLPYETTILQCHSYIHRLNNSFKLFHPIKKHLLKYKLINQISAFSRAKEDTDYIAVSQIIKNDYCKNFNISPEKIMVAYPGVFVKDFKEITKNDVLTFGIVANSSINKGGHYFLITLGILNLLFRKFKIKIIAPKFKQDFFMQLIITVFNLRKKIEALPFQNDMTDFYNNIDVLVLPSKNEAFGLVTLEAMERGKPCIVSSTAGSSEIISKENGFVFNRNSFVNFLKTINKVIKLYNKDFATFKTISNNARKTVEQYTWHKFATEAIK